jgi:hypothetical protein
MTGRQTLLFLNRFSFPRPAGNATTTAGKHEETKNKMINGGHHSALVVYFVARTMDNDVVRSSTGDNSLYY